MNILTNFEINNFLFLEKLIAKFLAKLKLAEKSPTKFPTNLKSTENFLQIS